MPSSHKKFTVETLEALADDLRKGRIPLDRVTISDDVQAGLRAIVRNTGLISYHVNYEVDDSRPYLKLGDHNPGHAGHLSITEARHLATVVRSLAGAGIDVQAGLHERLIRELQDKGVRWKP